MGISLKLPQISQTKRLLFVIVSCTIYFLVEITVGLKTGSLALIVDAFHQLNDLISYVVALVATRLTMSSRQRPGFTFALKRCEIVGAFFNASILLALALSIFLQSIERFIDVPEVEDPFLVFVVGCVGVVLNALCIMLCHDTHGHSHGHGHGGHSHAHPASTGIAAKGKQEHSDTIAAGHDHSDHHHEHHHRHSHDHSHDHTHSDRHPRDEIYHQSLEAEIRAVRIPSAFTQIARPISQIIHDVSLNAAQLTLQHGHSHSHPHSRSNNHAQDDASTARPLSTAARKSHRFSRWRHTLFFQDEESRLGIISPPNLTLAIPANTDHCGKPKHRSLDPGSPRYVLPDGQRWYDTDQLQPRRPAGRDDVGDGQGHGGVRGKGEEGHHDHHSKGDHHDHHHHEHGPAAGHSGHSHHNLGFAGVLIHLIGDALNNIGVVIAAVVMWQSTSPSRFYADPAVSVLIGLIIFAGSLPLTISSARVLLEAAPKGLDLAKIQSELVLIPVVASVHCLHVWQLTETDLIGSVEVGSEARDLVVWSLVEKSIRRHLAGYGINHITISPEFVPSSKEGVGKGEEGEGEDGHLCTVLNASKT